MFMTRYGYKELTNSNPFGNAGDYYPLQTRLHKRNFRLHFLKQGPPRFFDFLKKWLTFILICYIKNISNKRVINFYFLVQGRGPT